MQTDSLYKIFDKAIEGEARFDEISRTIYSTDASIYEVTPAGVIFPKNRDDVIKTVRLAHANEIAIIPRGGATGITGGCLGEGLVLDTTKYFNRILHIDPEGKFAICEPGVIQDDLNKAVSSYGLRLGPDTSTGNRATIGGMVANNAAGARSLRYGCMAEHVEKIEMVLDKGRLESFSAISLESWKRLSSSSNIYSVCWDLRNSLKEEIIKHFPSIPRHVSGYNFPHLLTEEQFNPCRLIAGSEGTLGVMTQITVRLSPLPQKQLLCLIPCTSLSEAFDQTLEILSLKPLTLEVIDHRIIEAGRNAPAFKNALHWLPAGSLPALLVVEFDGPEGMEKAKSLEKRGATIISAPDVMKQVWELRKAGLGLLLSKRGFTRAIAFLEDISIPPKHLGPFMMEFIKLLEVAGKQAGIYGHAGAGCMHIRPYIDLQSPEDRKAMVALMHATTQLLLKYGGVLSGEHGDGLIRSWLNEVLFGPKIYKGFVEFKEAFDPLNLMNPNKIVRGPPVLENLRKRAKDVKTFLDFSRDGGIGLAVDMCNGNGLCRKKEGTMCPSFQATGDEKDSTRARANALRAVLTGESSFKDFTDQGIHDILDLCISCKGCKTECPSQVDMAKLKAEALYQYQEKHGVPLRSRLFGHIGKVFYWAKPFASFINYLGRSRLGKKGMSLFGISSKRTLPALAKETFESWVKRQRPYQSEKEVILFNDTFTNFCHPEIGMAAYKLLHTLGYKVIVPSWNCCGRTALSKGLLPTAKGLAQKLFSVLKTLPEVPIVVLEPSCLSALIDDYADLSESVIPRACTLEEFLLQPANLEKLKNNFYPLSAEIAVHIHCHQKSLLGYKPTLTLLKSLPNVKPTYLPTGCCGMAGSFGFEKEHAEISLQIGELTLFPAIRSTYPHIPIISNGTSCRSQILQGTERKPLHLAEYLYFNLKHGDGV